jgi:nicotinamide riboside transporter PnuC
MVNTAVIVNGALVVALVVFVLYQQTIARPVVARRLWLLPGILAVVGVIVIANINKGVLSYTALTWIGIDIVVSIVLGVVRGFFVRVYERDGVMWRQGNVITVSLWIVAILVRVVIGYFADKAGVGNVSTAALELALAASLLAQNGVIAYRGTQQGLPFAPDLRQRRRTYSR